MCYPASSSYKIVWFFKSIDWVFFLWAIAVALCLMFGKSVFQQKIRGLNWLIQQHGLEGKVIGTDRAFKQFHRDLWILLVLIFVVVLFIHFM